MRFLVSLVLVGGGLAEGGVTLSWETTRDDGKIVLEVTKLEGEHARFESSASPTEIWDGHTRTLMTLHPQTKSYKRLDAALGKRAAEEAEAAGIKAMRSELAETLSQMQPKERAQAEAMIASKRAKADPPPPLSIVALKKKRAVSGYDCEMYRVEQGSFATEICVVPWDKAPVKKADLHALRGLSELMQKLVNVFGATYLGGEFNPSHDDLVMLPGLPVQGASLRPAIKTTTLKSVTRGPVGASEFELPAGFVDESQAVEK